MQNMKHEMWNMRSEVRNLAFLDHHTKTPLVGTLHIFYCAVPVSEYSHCCSTWPLQISWLQPCYLLSPPPATACVVTFFAGAMSQNVCRKERYFEEVDDYFWKRAGDIHDFLPHSFYEHLNYFTYPWYHNAHLITCTVLASVCCIDSDLSVLCCTRLTHWQSSAYFVLHACIWTYFWCYVWLCI